MREPKHYPADTRGHHVVAWYEGGKRERKTFIDPIRAEIFYQEKLLGHPIDTNSLVLKEVATIKKYFAPDKLAALEAQIAKLREQLAVKQPGGAEEPPKNAGPPEARPTRQSTNFRAFQWAYGQDDLSVTAKAVLMTFAVHANQHGYSWPGVDRIASTWGMDRDTVRRQIDALLVRRKICHTKKRAGSTGQVKVYRLPKITYESGGKSPPFKNEASGGKARDKRGISGGESAPNKEQGTKETNAVAVDQPFRITVMAAATAATDSLDLVKKMLLHFPDHNVAQEYQKFCKWRDDRGRPKVASKFAEWMLRAEKPIKRPAVAPAETEPPEVSLWFAEKYPRFTKPEWGQMPESMKAEFEYWKKDRVAATLLGGDHRAQTS